MGLGAPASPDLIVRYINEYFEIRNQEQAVKYVYNGPMRIARITGSLDGSQDRVQRLRVFEGWNLLSIMVDAEDAAEQLGLASEEAIEAVFLWDAAAGQFKPWAAGDAIGQGDIFLAAGKPAAGALCLWRL